MSVKRIPVKLHFYAVKPEFTGVYLFLSLLIQNIDCGYSLVSTINVLSKNVKDINFFLLKIFIFHNFKNLCILYGHVFAMKSRNQAQDLSLQTPVVYN